MGVLDELVAQAEAATTELEGITAAAEQRDGKSLTEAEETRSTELLAVLDELDGKLATETRSARRSELIAEARSRVPQVSADVKVTAEKMVYGPGSENSWVADTIWVQTRSPFDPRHQAAGQRLSEYAHQVEREYADGTKAGKLASKQLREVFREMAPEEHRSAVSDIRERGRLSLEQKQELRAVGTGGGATASAAGGGGAALVSPVIFVDDTVPYREAGRAFADQCRAQTLPDYGMVVYIPHITGPAGIGTQTEGQGVPETDPTAGYLSGSLSTLAGEVTVSQQLLDRSGPNFSYDEMVFDQLRRDYAPKFDVSVLNAALAGATYQNWAGSFSVALASGAGGLQGQVSKAKGSIRTAAGTFLNPSHMFTRADRWENIVAWADTTARPVVVPGYAGPFNAIAAGSSDGDAGVEGSTGYKFNGLRTFTDQNIPAFGTGTGDQIIVGDLSQVFVYESTPVVRVVPQTLANNLQVLLQMYSYTTTIVCYPAGIVAISGTALGAITYSS